MARVAALVLLACVACPALAQFVPGRGWVRVPQVLVIGEERDPRVAMIREAVAHWNSVLEQLGSGFRMGAVATAQADVPSSFVHEVGQAMDRGLGYRGRPPEVLYSFRADLIVVLSDQNFVSFGGVPLGNGKLVAGIKSLSFPPLTAPNVPLNVIVHELGHAIGLRHHSDPSGLMCGRPAPCRPDLFRSDEKKIFPLLDSDRAALLRAYPPDWTPAP
jgi:hypothetical protein